MAGSGNWTAQNKILPGVYINFSSNGRQTTSEQRSGIVACPIVMDWGAEGTVFEITPGMDTTKAIGYTLDSAAARWAKLLFLGTNRTAGASKILAYRIPCTGQAKATVTTGNLTATAKYYGARGNDLSIVIAAQLSSGFNVKTYLAGVLVDEQADIVNVADLNNNDWIVWSGTGAVAASAGSPLVGGATGDTFSTEVLSTALTALEPYKFDILAWRFGTIGTARTAAEAFIKAQNEQNGMYCQLVEPIADASPSPDSRYVVAVYSTQTTNCVTLADGTQLAIEDVALWAAGALAGASYNQSLTNATFPTATAALPMTVSQQENAIQNGEFIVAEDNGRVYIVQDINSLKTFTDDISEVYRYNRTMRLCNQIANDLFTDFSTNYIGIVNNNESGRAQFKSSIVGYLLNIQRNNGIDEFSAEDVIVEKGESIDAVVVSLAVKPVGTVEKIYMTISMNV